MSVTPSPLRYPGGKTGIQRMVSTIIRSNDINGGHYAEPYAGGCGLALSLMFNQHIHEIHLNDLDRSIWAFWYSILNNTQDFIEKINDTDVTIAEWYKQRDIQNGKNKCNAFELGFSTFFLNRTNRSGIILKAGVIGGFGQNGKYALDCRFNKKRLIDKIKRIKKYRHRIHLYNMDAIDFIKSMDVFLPKKAMFCIDPPYFDKGSFLYTNCYNAEDHKTVYKAISEINHPWILTYDNAKEISDIYNKYSQYLYALNYSAAEKKIGTELLIAANNILIPEGLALEKRNNDSLNGEGKY